MKQRIFAYRETLKRLLGEIVVTDKAKRKYPFESGVEKTVSLILKCARKGGKLIFIGNGASAAMSSHLATDFWKNGGIRAVTFNDAAGLTCVSNDYAYEYVFEKPIEMFAQTHDVLIAISSSGKSRNILNGVAAAQRKKIAIITFSGFKPDNPLRASGDFNFYVPESDYGPVEVLHHMIGHGLIDMVISIRKEKGSLSRG